MAADDRLGGDASISRRNLLAASASGGLALALAGCGSPAGHPHANPEFRGADADVLDVVLAAEYRAVAAYAHVARLLDGAHRALAQRIGVQDAAHVYALTGAIDRLGGVATPGAGSYGFTARDAAAALGLVAEAEDMAIAASIDAMPKLTDLEGRGIVVSVANSDAQHAALIAQARGLPPLATAIVRGRA